MRVDGNGGMLAFDNMMNRPLRGTMDWTRASVVLDVPIDADGIAFGMILTGDDAWIDDALLEVVGSDVASTNTVTPSPNPSNAEAMRKNYQTVRVSAGSLGFEPH